VRGVDDYDAVGCARKKQAALRFAPMSVAQLHQQTAQLILAVDRLL